MDTAKGCVFEKDYMTAVDNYQQAIDIYKTAEIIERSDTTQVLKYRQALGELYKKQADLYVKIKYYQDAYKTYKLALLKLKSGEPDSITNPHLISTIYATLCTVLNLQRSFEQAVNRVVRFA